jgi:alpha-L-fucosidase
MPKHKTESLLVFSVVLVGCLAAHAATAAEGEWRNLIVKRGYLGSPLVETTPFVFKDRLYRLESWQRYWDLPGLPPPNTQSEHDAVRVYDIEAKRIVSTPFTNHGFATALVWDGRVYVFAACWDRPGRKASRIDVTSSDDLVHWTAPVPAIQAEAGENLYNVAVCRDAEDRGFVLLYETDDPKYVPFTFKYCRSGELTRGWRLVPEALYGTKKYVGGPALYCFGGVYYTLYLQDLGGRWETRVTRSRDLMKWEDAPDGRPFVTFDVKKDRVPLRPPEVKEINASDVELCEWPAGKTYILFSGSDQQYAGDLQWATFDGTPRELLERFYK